MWRSTLSRAPASRRALAAVVLVVGSPLVGCEQPEPFKWRDTEGHVCEVICDDAGNTCAHDLTCNVAPKQDCSFFEKPDGGRVPERPCWFVAYLYIYEPDQNGPLGKDAVGLCQGCCCAGDVWCRGLPYPAPCKPLVCNPRGQAPPEPFVCRDGYVYQERRK